MAKVRFGKDAIVQLGKELKGRKVMLVQNGLLNTDYIQYLLMKENAPSFGYTMENPLGCTVRDLENGVELSKRVGATAVVGFGGGTVLDGAKGIAAMMENGPPDEFVYDHLGEKQLENKVAQLVLVPSNASSCSEMSQKTYVFNEDGDSKIPLTSTPIVPQCVFIDPKLATSVPLDLTVEGALMATAKCMEVLFMNSKDAAINEMCVDGIQATTLALQNRDQIIKSLQILEFREQLAAASLHASVATNVVGANTVHALGFSVCNMVAATYGQMTTSFLPPLMARYEELAEDADDEVLLKKAQDVLAIINNNSDVKYASIASWFDTRMAMFHLKSAQDIGFDETIIDDATDKTMSTLEDSIAVPLLDREEIHDLLQNIISK